MSSGAIGEGFVACELMRLGFCCLISPDPGCKVWDAVVYDADKNVGVTLQIKTVTWPGQGSTTKAAMQGNFSARFDFLVIVVVDFPGDDKYLVYVVPREDIVSSGDEDGGIPTGKGEKFRFTNKTIPFSTFIKHKHFFDSTYLGKWQRVQKLLTSRAASRR